MGSTLALSHDLLLGSLSISIQIVDCHNRVLAGCTCAKIFSVSVVTNIWRLLEMAIKDGTDIPHICVLHSIF